MDFEWNCGSGNQAVKKKVVFETARRKSRRQNIINESMDLSSNGYKCGVLRAVAFNKQR